MPKRPSTSKPLINNNSSSVTPKERIPSFLTATTSGDNTLSVPSPSTPKATALPHTPSPLPPPSPTVSASRVKEKIPSMSHHRPPFSVTSSSILSAREDSSPELSTMLSCMAWSTPPARLTTLPLKILPRSALKN